MCGIAGIVSLNGAPVPELRSGLEVMSKLLIHRGPDDHGLYMNESGTVGLCHRRLSILDLSRAGRQPMRSPQDTTISFNGEIYNFIELQKEESSRWEFRTGTDTETILAAYQKDEQHCLSRLRGMFAFALWDERKNRLLCARDRFGIKPFYYTVVDNVFYFASEPKALLPFLKNIETDPEALSEYLTFQYTITEKTLFRSINQLLPGHELVIENGRIQISRYWDVMYEMDQEHSSKYFTRKLQELLDDSIDVHLRSDVPIGGYISGGIDSSLMAILASRHDENNRLGFHGRFTDYPGYDESEYAEAAAKSAGIDLKTIDITADDFRENISDVIYHLDFPIAGPGSFPQFMVSKLAAEHVKVVLGGQGGDEIFGGYARYLIAYFEQCIKAAIDGTYRNGNFVVTIESIVPNLGLLREYKPMMKQFWKEGLFDDIDERYFRLVNRANDMTNEVDWGELSVEHSIDKFKAIFNNKNNVKKEAYFDKMTHFDFKCLLPALLHVEDRMSMAHGLESRVPLLDHPLIEFVARIPADIKFENGHMKHLLKSTYKDILPERIVQRRDKMGFPVPLKEWFGGELRDLVTSTFEETRSKQRPYFNADAILQNFDKAERFSRKNWALFSIEMWHQRFHDRQLEYSQMLKTQIQDKQEVISI